VTTFQLDEILATKLRALYQRRKGRDLFDLAMALHRTSADPMRIVEAFNRYMDHGGHRVTRSMFEDNLANKLDSATFSTDTVPILMEGFDWDVRRSAAVVRDKLIRQLPEW